MCLPDDSHEWNCVLVVGFSWIFVIPSGSRSLEDQIAMEASELAIMDPSGEKLICKSRLVSDPRLGCVVKELFRASNVQIVVSAPKATTGSVGDH
jgi:hypothetical protein